MEQDFLNSGDGPPSPLTPQPPARRFEVPPLVFVLVLLLTVFVSFQFVGGLITYLLLGADITRENVDGFRLANTIGQFLLLLLPTLLSIKLLDKDWRAVLRLNPTGVRQVLLVMLTVVALQFALNSYMQLQEHVLNTYLLPDALKPLVEQVQELFDRLYKSLLEMRTPWEFAMVMIAVAVTPAFCEEVLFRGVVQTALETGLRIRMALLLNGLLFAAFHLNPISFLPLAILGCYLSFITWRGNSIYLAMVAHVTNNAFSVATVYFFGIDVDKPASSLMSPLALTALGLAGACLAVLLTIYFWRITGDKEDISQTSA